MPTRKSTSQIQLRRVRRSLDLESITELEQLCFPQDAWTKEELNALIRSDISGGRVAVARRSIIGFVLYEVNASSIYIVDLAVHPDHRGKGVASALLEHTTRAARHLEKRTIRLHVRRSNTKAISLYERLGFHVARTEHNYYTDEDALVMAIRVQPRKQSA